MTKCMVMEFISLKVDLYIWVNGLMEKLKEKDYMNSIMEQFMMETGKTINYMEKEHFKTLKIEDGKENVLKESINLNNKYN